MSANANRRRITRRNPSRGGVKSGPKNPEKPCTCNMCVADATGNGLKPLRVALCLFGQPRRFKDGHKVFMDWLKAPYHHNVTVDVFFHTWFMTPTNGNNNTFTVSAYRPMPARDKVIQEGTIDKLIELYNPVAYFEEKPIIFDRAMYEDSLLYSRTNEMGKDNANNTLSQQYSRQKVRDILFDYMKQQQVPYDFVIGSRFDFLIPITVNLNELQPEMVHLTSCRFPRKHLPDPLIITNTQIFGKLFNVFRNLANLVNNEVLAKHFYKVCKELYIFHPEELLHMNYIYYFNDNSAFVYHDGIPNFHW